MFENSYFFKISRFVLFVFHDVIIQFGLFECRENYRKWNSFSTSIDELVSTSQIMVGKSVSKNHSKNALMLRNLGKSNQNV